MDADVPVLVVGGSLVGLSTALFLSWHGIPALVVERHPGTAIHPRAAHFSQRTLELYRSVGIEDAVLAAAEREFVQNGAIMSVESLAGRELEWFFRNVNEGFEDLSPSRRIFVTQIGLEPILRMRAEELGARLRYGSELVSFEQDGSGVTAIVRDRETGVDEPIRASYVVAADGARSPMRDQLGISLLGRGSFSNSITIYFRANVWPLLRDRNLSVVYVFHPRLVGFFRFSKAGDAGFLVVNATFDGDGVRNTDVSSDSTDDRCVEYVREALGDAEIAVEIEGVQHWTASAVHADRYAEGRVFLAGDAAHTMPPTGGFGGNTGVQDAHNLAWKLALVLRGDAGPELLSTYAAEREPVGEFTTEQAYTRYVLRLDPGLGKDDLRPFVVDAPIELGYRYHSDAIVADGGGDGELYEDPHAPSGRPGTRAPHVELSRSASTLDLFGRSFVLLTAAERGDWEEEVRAAAGEVGVEVDFHRIVAPGFREAYGLEGGGATLVRPDGFVAWRSGVTPSARALIDVLRQVLHSRN